MAPPVSGESSSVGVWSTVRNFVEDAAEGAVVGDFSENDSAGKAVGQIGVGLIPIVGQIADGRDTIAATKHVIEGKEGAWKDLGMALIGWIPLLGDWAKGARNGSKVLQRGGTEALEASLERVARKGWFHVPEVKGDYALPAGEGFTDKFGNVTYSLRGSAQDKALVYHHEMVHSWLSPKLNVLKEFRADVRMDLYQRSSLMRYLEEALAETYAQARVNGIGATFEGLKFPITNGYVELKDVLTEAAIGSVVVGGATYGVYVANADD